MCLHNSVLVIVFLGVTQRVAERIGSAGDVFELQLDSWALERVLTLHNELTIDILRESSRLFKQTVLGR